MIDEEKLIGDLSKWKDSLEDPQPFDEAGVIIRNVIKTVIDIINDQPTIQPQGIDKNRLEHVIKLLEFCKQRHIDIATQLPHTAEIEAGKISCYEMAIKVVRENLQQPTTDGWIPVSSGKLPKEEDYSEDGFVLVQTGGGIIYKGCYDVESGFWVDETGFKFAYLPIAWQPLPPAYKESEEQ